MSLEPPLVWVEVVYALPQRAIAKSYGLRSPATLADALAAAAADADFAGIDVIGSPVGIFGRLARRDEPLAVGDRIEIYRGPAVDPKAARRARAKRTGSPRPR
jgi:putative ubiquitin-RnfH superfamily antitoxin RatB of RatAB toxin-antitoxin module